jgi:hypothetical protein
MRLTSAVGQFELIGPHDEDGPVFIIEHTVQYALVFNPVKLAEYEYTIDHR